MNARQKAKKYKKELDRIRTSPFKLGVIYDRKNIVTLKATLIENYDRYELSPVLSNQMIKDTLYKRLSNDLTFKDAVIITRNIDEVTGDIKYTATLQLLMPEKGGDRNG